MKTMIKTVEGLGIEYDENVVCDVCRCKSYLLSSVFDEKHSSKTENNNNFVTYIIVSERIRLRDKYLFV